MTPTFTRTGKRESGLRLREKIEDQCEKERVGKTRGLLEAVQGKAGFI